MKLLFRIICLLGVLSFGFACSNDDEDAIILEFNTLLGGETTVAVDGPTAYSQAMPNLVGDEAKLHLDADGIFAQPFVTAPAQRFGGLGPQFNQNACQSCHIRNGRGNVSLIQGDQFDNSLLVRTSLPGVGENGGFIPVPGLGVQMQTKSLISSTPEGRVTATFIKKLIEFSDGSTVEIQRPQMTIDAVAGGIPSGTLFSFRNSQPIFGLGLLEAIPEAAILALADPDDLNKDGISGKANRVFDFENNIMSLGRFGWKAGNASLLTQAASAANQDMGLTNFLLPNENCADQENCQTGLLGSHDLAREDLISMAFYTQTLGVPAQRNSTDANVLAGKNLFVKLQCNSCHKPEFTTGSTHVVAGLNNQKIHPFTDMLLHDMGDDLAEERPEFAATGREWRTAPLWGIGLTKTVNPKAKFLHDGRANTIEEAILWHGGEAENTVKAYKKLKKSERENLMAFVNSL